MKKLISMLTALAIMFTLAGCKPQTGKEIVTDSQNQSDAPKTPAGETPKGEELVRDPSLEDCPHCYEEQGLFDDKTMTVSGIPQWTPVKMFSGMLWYPEHYSEEWSELFLFHDSVLIKDGKIVENGFIEEGMKVRIYQCNEDNEKKFYGEYTIKDLKPEEKPSFWLGYSVNSSEETFGIGTIACVEQGTTISAITSKRYSDVFYEVRENGKKITEGTVKEGMEFHRVYSSGKSDMYQILHV